MTGRTEDGFRTERDSMGEVRLPEQALWGAQTQRAVANFPISGQPMPRPFIRALGLIKAAAAEANRELGLVTVEMAGAIVSASLEVATGDHDAHFPVDVFQTGSGTSSNMNANEVIADAGHETVGAARAPQRPRQLRPVVERRDPDRDPRRRHAGHP